MRSRSLLGFVLAAAFLAILVASSTPARASTDVTMQGYISGGSFTPMSSGDSMPSGATLEVRAWADLYSCDPITVYWGDGTHNTMSFGGSFAETFTHVYASDGLYTVSAFDCQSVGGNTVTVNVGGMGSVFDPSSVLFAPTVFGLILGLLALGMALGTPRAVAPGKGAGPATPAQAWWPAKHLLPGIPASMATHVVSYRDIPVGAPRQPDPRIPMKPGEPTDVFADPHCPACGGSLGYVAGGWFCMNPTCPLRQPSSDPIPRFIHGL